MSIGQEKPVSGRQMFLEQRARLQSSISVSRTNDTARRFNRLGETQKKAIILLANEAAQRFKGLPSLTHSHLSMPFEQFSSQDKVSLMLGIKRLAELAAALPWEFPIMLRRALKCRRYANHHHPRRMAQSINH